jgi:hypothetical protein
VVYRHTYFARGRAHLEQIAVAARILDRNRRFCAIRGICVPNSANIHLDTDVLPVDLEEISHRELCDASGSKGKVLDICWVVDKGDHDEDYWGGLKVSRCARLRKCGNGGGNERTIGLLMLARELDEGVPEREWCSRRIDDVKATYRVIRSDEAIWPVGSTNHRED